MARSAILQALNNTIYSGLKREPSVSVLLFDNSDTYSEIVLGTFQQVPRDLTEFVVSVTHNETLSSLSTISIKLTTNDESVLGPYDIPKDRIVQLIYQDKQSDDRFVLFTGATQGQPGFVRNRSGQDFSLSIKCSDRGKFFNEKDLDSPNYDFGTDLGDMLVDIATDSTYGMGLDREEVRFGLLRQTVQHTFISLKGVKFIEGMNLVGFIQDKQIDFDSEGFLVLRDLSLDKQPIRTYANEDLFISITWPEDEVDLNNCVVIVGLSNVLSKVLSPLQELVEITGTTGFFQAEYTQRVYFSEDRQGRAQDVFVSESNINGQLASFISGDASIKDINDFSGVVVIKNPYQPYVFAAFFSGYIAFFVLAALDVFGLGDEFLLAAAIWLTLGLAIMQQLGTFRVTVSGTPFKMVYKEIEGEACWDNLEPAQIRRIRIENHIIHSQALADSIAFRELKKETIKGNKRTVVMPQDPVLEKGDIFELPDGSRYFINSISRNFNNRSDNVTMSLNCYNIRSGLEFNDLPGFSIY